MNTPPNLYCRAWQYLFEIVTVANISPILIVAGASGLSSAQSAMLIQSAMIIAGIGTLIQLFPLWKIGSGLPIVMGISF